MTNTRLKIIALITMLLDHIWIFFPLVPYLFHILGRISAPLFLYCCVVGFTNTRNKKSYILRLYVFSIIMTILNCFLFDSLDDFYFNFIRSLFVLAICCLTIEVFKKQNHQLKKILLVFWFIQAIIVFLLLTNLLIFTSDKLFLIFLTMLGSPIVLEGGIFFVILGILMFLFQNSKIKLSIAFICATLAYILAYNFSFLLKISHWLDFNISRIAGNLFIIFCELFESAHPAFVSDSFIENPQWLMILALPFIVLYNHERGKGIKKFFYIFYPLHLIVLVILSKFFKL